MNARWASPNPPSSGDREPKWRRYLRFYRANPAADLDDELRDHLESTEEALVAQGMSPGAAREEAARRFGDVDGVRRTVQRLDLQHLRRSRVAEARETLVQDARFALRSFVRSPAFTLVAALSIAVGVAANSTVFSLVNAALLRPIPGANATRLVRVYVNHHSPFSWRDLSWFRDRAKSFDGLVGERSGAMSFQLGANHAERVRTSLVTNGFFTTLGVPIALGRPFGGDERTASASLPVAVLSHQFWMRRFGGDSSIVGRTVSIAGQPATIVGVLGADFHSSVIGWTPEVLLPLAAAPALTGTKLEDFGGSLYATGRLRPGVRASEAAAELDVLMSSLARTDSARYERMSVRLDHTRGVNAEMRTPVAAASAFVMGMVALVLLIACANVANLLLGRAASRQTEIGVRLALGASRARIVRQLLTESFLLSVLGTALGVAIAFVLTRVLVTFIPAEADIDSAFFAPDRRVLLFTGVMCIATTLLFGLVPALRAASPRVVPMLKAEAPRFGVRRRRGGLVAGQAALCVVLLAVASLFLRSLQSMRGLDPGFRVSGVIDVPLDLDMAGVSDTTSMAVFARVQQRVRGLPGVRSATLAAHAPLSGSNMETSVAPEGMTAASRFDYPSTYFNVVTPGYFETLGIPLRAGRPFLDTDGASAPRVAVVNETAASRWWPGQQATGKRFRWGGAEGPLVEVVGVARDADYNMPGESRNAFVYMPLAQERRTEMLLQLHASSNVSSIRDALWELLREEVPALPPPAVTAMREDMAITLLPVRAGASLLGALGLVALLLAATGIYGVTAHAVARRTREIGIRAALGAGRAQLLRMVVGDSLRPVFAGLAVGLALALLAALGLSRVLYGIHPLDPVVLPAVALTLLLVSVVASFAPARRASSVDPVIAMRE